MHFPFRLRRVPKYDLPDVLPHYDQAVWDKRWGDVYDSLARIDSRLRNTCESIADLDCGLRHIDDTSMHRWFGYMQSFALGEPVKKTETFPSELRAFLKNYGNLSGLWVLQAYELVRTIHQYLGASHLQSDVFTTLKLQFERIRIPLAKNQVPRNWPDDLGGFVSGNWSQDKGFGWGLNEDVHISRNELADCMISALKQLHEEGKLQEIKKCIPDLPYM